MVYPKEQQLGLLIGQRLGPRIAALRQRKGLTQAEFAEQLEIEPESVSRLERGASLPSIKRLASIADVLNTDVAALLGDALPIRVGQSQQIEAYLHGLNSTDRAMLVSMVETLSYRLRTASS